MAMHTATKNTKYLEDRVVKILRSLEINFQTYDIVLELSEF
jgi:hypothetical protein